MISDPKAAYQSFDKSGDQEAQKRQSHIQLKVAVLSRKQIEPLFIVPFDWHTRVGARAVVR